MVHGEGEAHGLFELFEKFALLEGTLLDDALQEFVRLNVAEVEKLQVCFFLAEHHFLLGHVRDRPGGCYLLALC